MTGGEIDRTARENPFWSHTVARADDGPALAFSPDQWTAFLAAIQAEELSLQPGASYREHGAA